MFFKYYWLVLIFYFLFISGSISEIYAQSETEVSIFRNVNNYNSNTFDYIFSFTNNSLGYITFGTPAIIYTGGLINKSNYDKNSALLVVTSNLSTGILTFFLKEIFQRDRPFAKLDDVRVLGDSLSPHKSFPSGHAALSFSLATMLSIRYKSPFLVIPVFLYALLTTYGRIYSGVHFPTDVISGSLLGVSIAFLTDYLFRMNIKTDELRQNLPFISVNIPIN